MSITRDYKETINERINKNPAFTAALLDEAITLFLNGEPDGPVAFHYPAVDYAEDLLKQERIDAR